MLIYPLLALLPHFLRNFNRAFIFQNVNASYESNQPSCPDPVMAFINEEVAGYFKEEAIIAINKATVVTTIDPLNPAY